MIPCSAVLVAVLVTGAGAQVGAPPVPPAAADTAKPVLAPAADTMPVVFERPNGALLRPGTTTYELTSTRAGQIAPLGVRTVQVGETTLAGLPVWLLTESRTGSPVETTDSLYLNHADLAPLRWTATSGRSAVGASFSHDTVFGALQSYQGRSSFVVGLGPGALVTPAMLERIVELLPLRVGYRALASLLVVELGAPRALPATIAVEREEPLPLGEQAVECWLVSVRAGATEERLWVTKEGSRVVKTEQVFGTGTLTSVLRPPAPPVDVPGAVTPAAPPVTPPVSP